MWKGRGGGAKERGGEGSGSTQQSTHKWVPVSVLCAALAVWQQPVCCLPRVKEVVAPTGAGRHVKRPHTHMLLAPAISLIMFTGEHFTFTGEHVLL